jgi:hypothetical protein
LSFLDSHSIAKLLQASSATKLETKTSGALLAQFPRLPDAAVLAKSLASALSATELLTPEQRSRALKHAGLEEQPETQ